MRSSLIVVLLACSALLGEDDKPEKKKRDGKPNPVKQAARILVFEDYDKDRDGRLSGEELSAYFFDRSDVDGDERLTKTDFDALPEGKREQAERLLMLDRDGDGAVSAEEWEVPRQVVKRLDKDGDGALTKQEADPGAAIMGGSGDPEKDIDGFVSRFDKDRDGKVSKGEYTGPEQLFGRVDTDEDGSLSRDEIAKFLQAAAKRGGTTGPADFVQRFDKNGDGRVTKEEFGGPETTFARLDANGDGAITSADGK